VPAALGLVLLCGVASAQQMIESKLRLEVTTEGAMLIVGTLGRIGCPTVSEWATCRLADELLRDLREQLKAQGR